MRRSTEMSSVGFGYTDSGARVIPRPFFSVVGAALVGETVPFFMAIEDERPCARHPSSGGVRRSVGREETEAARLNHRAASSTSSARLSLCGRWPMPRLFSRAISSGLYIRPLKSRRAGGIRPWRSRVCRCSGVTPSRFAASPICRTNLSTED